MRDPYDVSLEELGLSVGTLTELHSMGVSSVGMAMELITSMGSQVVLGIPDLEAMDLSELEERLVMAGYLNEFDDDMMNISDEDDPTVY